MCIFSEPGFSYKETIRHRLRWPPLHGGCCRRVRHAQPESRCRTVPEHLRAAAGEPSDEGALHARCCPTEPSPRGEKGEAPLRHGGPGRITSAAFSDDGRGRPERGNDARRPCVRAKDRWASLSVAHCEVQLPAAAAAASTTGTTPGLHGHQAASARRANGGPGGAGPAAGGEDRLRLPCLPRVHEGERGADPARPSARAWTSPARPHPHYLTAGRTWMLQEDGRFKMNPPLR